MPFHERDQHQGAAGLLDNLPANHFFRLVVSALHEHVGPDGVNERKRRFVVEDGHGVHALQGRQQLAARVLVVERARFALQASDALVAVQAHDQEISQRRGLPQQARVPDVKQVEAAVGEHDSFRPASAGAASSLRAAASRVKFAWSGSCPWCP